MGAPARPDQQPVCQKRRPFAWKAHAVDQGSILRQAKQARLRVARLWAYGDRTQLKMPKSQGRQAAPAQSVLIITGGQANRVTKAQSKQLNRPVGDVQERAQQRPGGRQGAKQAQGLQSQGMGLFGGQAKVAASECMRTSALPGGSHELARRLRLLARDAPGRLPVVKQLASG